MAEDSSMDTPKKWWWLVAVAVPVVVAVITIVPDMLSTGAGGGGDTIQVRGTQFNDKVYFNEISVVIDQARAAGQELSERAVEDLESAMTHVKAGEFEDAIPLFEAVSEVVQAPALINNIGAAYLASGQKETALGYLDRVSDQWAARKNLSLVESPPTEPPEIRGGGRSVLARSPTQVEDITAELIEFSRFESIVTLKVRLINSGDDQRNVRNATSESYLLDEGAVERHALFDQSNGGDSIVPGHGSLEIWAKFVVPKEKHPTYLTVILNRGMLFEHIEVP